MSETTARLIGRTGAVSGKDFTLGETARIGAAREAEIRIRAEGVSRIHARVWREGDGYWLEDAGSTNGTFLSGIRVRKDRLRHLDVVTLGRTVDLIFVSREGAAAAGPGAAPRPSVDARRVVSASLEPLDGSDAGTSIEVLRGEMTLGRADSNNVVVASPAVSKVHARVERTADGVFIQDLDSVNGTTVNATRIDTRVALGRHDRVTLAGVRSFRVSIERSGAGASADAGEPASESPSDSGPVFNQEWKTRLVWSAEELEELAQLAQPTPVPESAPPPEPPKPKRKAAAKPAKPAADTASTPKPREARAATPAESAPPPPAQPASEAPGHEPATELATIYAGREDKPGRVGIKVRLVGDTTHTLDTGTTTIGRSDTATLRLHDRKISRMHSEITVSDDAVAIADTDSVNGTLVNDTEITEPQTLRNGDRVKIGDMEWTVEITRS